MKSAFSLVIFAFTTLIAARDLHGWTGNCDGSSVSCLDAAAGLCCQNNRPFCTSCSCTGCNDGNDIYSFNSQRCDVTAFATCRLPDDGCCMNCGRGNSCAVQWFLGTGNRRGSIMERRSETTSNVESIFVEEDGTERKCIGTALPELMTFKDTAGQEHRIFMDIGTHDNAYQLVIDKNWEELKKFPKYVGQKHAKREAGKAVGSEGTKKPEADK